MNKVMCLPYLITRNSPNIDNGLYALIFKFKKDLAFNMKFKISQSDFNNYYFKEYFISSTGSNTKLIYDVTEKNIGIYTVLIEKDGYYYLYAKGSLAGNALNLYVTECDALNHLDFIYNSKFTKNITSLEASEKIINMSTLSTSNVKDVWITPVDGWTDIRSSYVEKNGVIFVNVRVSGKTYNNSTLIVVNNLPLPNRFDGDKLMDYPFYYKCNGETDFRVGRCGLNGRGELTIWDAKNGATFDEVMIAFSYPKRY